MTAVDTLIADLKSQRYSFSPQNVIVPIDDFVAALAEIQSGLTPIGVESANTVFAGPASGAAALPTFRAIVAADLAATLILEIGNISFNSATVARLGLNSPSAGVIGFSTSSTMRFNMNSTSFFGQNANSFICSNSAASATNPTLIPNQSANTTGIGAQAAGNISLIVGGVEQFRISNGSLVAAANNGSELINNNASATVATVIPNKSAGTTGIGGTAGTVSEIVAGAEITRSTAAGFQVISGLVFQLGNAATTGLIAGALAALTTASIVILDSTGTAYRVPCVTP